MIFESGRNDSPTNGWKVGGGGGETTHVMGEVAGGNDLGRNDSGRTGKWAKRPFIRYDLPYGI